MAFPAKAFIVGLMIETPTNLSERPPVGNLTDFVSGVDEHHHLDIEVAVTEEGKVVLFHNHPFTKEIGWFEFDLGTCRLGFVFDGGDMRDAGLPLTKGVAKYMQNSHQILIVHLDDETGEAREGSYIPLIIHRGS